MEEQENEKRKPIPNRLFVSCPVCGTILLQAEGAKNAFIKCQRCHNMITVEVERNKVITLAPTDKSL